MLKRWGRVILAMLLVCFLLTTCTCAHKWKEATCTEPKTCVYCGMTEGEPLGHDHRHHRARLGQRLQHQAEGPRQAALLGRLGKHRTGTSCLYVKRLADVDTGVLGELVEDAVAETRRRYG